MAMTDFPQELLDAIVDKVAWLAFDSLLSLLKSIRCFGQQCRLHLYRKVMISAYSSPSAFRDFIMQCHNDDGPQFWSIVSEIMTRLTRLKAVTFTEALTFRGPLSKMLLEDLPRLSSVRTVKLQYVKGLFVEDVAHILSAFQDMSVLEIRRCNIVRDRDSSVVPPVPVALETLSLLHAQSFITEILAGSVAPPMISFHKLRRLIVAGAIMQRIWPSYEDLFLQIQGTVKEVILYTGPEVVPAKMTFFVNVPSLIFVPPSNSDSDVLSHILQVSHVERPASRDLEKLALVLNWRTDQHPFWSNLPDLLAKLTFTIPFSVCITLAWPSLLRPLESHMHTTPINPIPPISPPT
ncbi:hypothetical protein CPB85DRAFT_1563945 [Mucidula mucida]|nr:hypothetical protein CPB85DRAFT_1563945 [Mucidula mucida]